MEKIIYSILKELEDNENRMILGEKPIIPTKEDYNINSEIYGKIILRLEKDGLINCKYAKTKGLPSLVLSAEITSRGKIYLKENSKFGKVYNGLKEIKSFLTLS
ncbi:YjcQ family protein [Romboutsia sp. MSSM.1001216sp_RTP31141st1_G3_RTP31141_220114]|uniref:YjcQ family protein n=1 Tax=unclassified Romboutsia TaxID=2626894 RepID=UPI0031B5E7CE